MDIHLTPTPTKSPDETEVDTPPHTKPSSTLKNHHDRWRSAPAIVVGYKECLKNHAAAIGGHAVDGCGEFMPPLSAADTTSLTCAACGCHRNFHRRDPESPTSAITPPFLDFRHPPPPKRFSLSPSPPSPSMSPSPIPVPFPSHVFFGRRGAATEEQQAPVTPTVDNRVGRKRFRTKFSQEQKEKMRAFSAKVGWKLQKCDDVAVREFCHGIGVSRGVLKVWMHNNKNAFSKKEINGGGGSGSDSGGGDGCGGGGGGVEKKIGNGNGVHFHGTNGSSSSPA